jgi:hypothetical protein
MATPQRLAGAIVWSVLIAVRWAHATFVQRPVDFWLDTVLGNWEEAVKSFFREAFATLARWLNGLSAQVGTGILRASGQGTHWQLAGCGSGGRSLPALPLVFIWCSM